MAAPKALRSGQLHGCNSSAPILPTWAKLLEAARSKHAWCVMPAGSLFSWQTAIALQPCPVYTHRFQLDRIRYPWLSCRSTDDHESSCRRWQLGNICFRQYGCYQSPVHGRPRGRAEAPSMHADYTLYADYGRSNTADLSVFMIEKLLMHAHMQTDCLYQCINWPASIIDC